VLGTRAGNWLTRAQAEKLLSLPDPFTLKGKRDRALLALFVSAGLGREELATLSREQIQQRDGRWCLVDLVGKGGRVRTVAIPDWTQQAVALWLEAMPIKEGPVLGKVNKGEDLWGPACPPLPFTSWWSNMPSGGLASSSALTNSEKDLESALLREIERFLLELGAGFAFVERQKRIVVDGEDFYLDLLFYNRRLRRLVLVELKLGAFQAADFGQTQLYLRAG
jgi:hypothetical protein